MATKSLFPQICALALFGCILFTGSFARASAVTSFTTGGGLDTAYQLWAGTVTNVTTVTPAYTGSAVIMAASDGQLLCYETAPNGTNGTLLWSKNAMSGAFPFDLCVADTNHDGTPDLALVAASNGNLYAFSIADGSVAWTFTPPGTIVTGGPPPPPASPSVTPPLLQVCFAYGGTGTGSGPSHILTGGEADVLYSLTPTGMIGSYSATLAGSINVSSSTYANFPGAIRLLRAGPIETSTTNQDYVALIAEGSGFYGPISQSIVNPLTLTVPTGTNINNNIFKNPPGTQSFHSLCLANTEGNSPATLDMLLSSGAGTMIDYSNTCSYVSQVGGSIANFPYREDRLIPVTTTTGTDSGVPYIYGQYGNELIRYKVGNPCTLKDVTVSGTTASSPTTTGSDSFTCGAFNPANNTLYLGSSQSGDTQIVAVDLSQTTLTGGIEQWQSDFEAFDAGAQASSRLYTIRAKMSALQTNSFSRPSYQPARTNPIDVILFDERDTVTPYQLSQQTPKGTYSVCKFHYEINPNPTSDPSVDTTASLLATASTWNNTYNKSFIIGVGHSGWGKEPVYQPFDTAPFGMDKGLNMTMMAGLTNMPNLWGFELSEYQTNEGVVVPSDITDYVKPLAEWCYTNGKKIILRNREIMWDGNCYQTNSPTYAAWWTLFTTPDPNYPGLCKYRDVFVPMMEETSTRTQELSLAGRIGLWESGLGLFDRWGCQVVTDDATSDQLMQWGSQREVSHFVRNLISSASMGADVFWVSMHYGPDTENTYPASPAGFFTKIEPYYMLLDTGAVYIPAGYVPGTTGEHQTELASLSSACLQMNGTFATPTPDPNFLSHGGNEDYLTFPTDTQYEMVFNNLDDYWSGAPLPYYDFSSYAFNVTNRLLNFLPQLPYGMVAMVPPGTLLSGTNPNSPFTTVIKTDGKYFYNSSGVQYDPSSYKSTVTGALSTALALLPVKVTGDPAHWSAAWIHQNHTHLRVTLVDPGYLNPAQRSVTVNMQSGSASTGWTGTSYPGNFTCTDMLNNTAMTVNSNGTTSANVTTTIPVGSVCIIDVVKSN